MSAQIRNHAGLSVAAQLRQFALAAKTAEGGKAQRAAYGAVDGFEDPAAKVEQEVKEGFKKQFGEIAQSKERFHEVMRQVFHQGYDVKTAEQFRQRALRGDYSWLPPVKLVDSQTLQGGKGAYDAEAGVVYLNKNLSAKEAVATYVEEAGHHLDTKLRKGDTAGDEGEMFRRVLSGEKLSAAQIREIRTENDHGVINVNGRKVSVEFWNPFKAIGKAFKKIGKGIGKAFKAVGKGVKKVFTGIGKGVKKVVGGIAGVAKKVFNGIGKVGKKIFKGIGKVFNGVKNFFGKIGKGLGKFFKVFDFVAPFLNFIPGVGTAIYAGYNAVKGVVALASGKTKDFFGAVLGGLTGGVGGALSGVLGKVMNFGGKLLGGSGVLGKVIGFGQKLLGSPLGKVFGKVKDFLGKVPLGKVFGGVKDFLSQGPIGKLFNFGKSLLGSNPLGKLFGKAASFLGKGPLGKLIGFGTKLLGSSSPLGRLFGAGRQVFGNIQSRAHGMLDAVRSWLSPQTWLSRLFG
jgi:hypothetical protein